MPFTVFCVLLQIVTVEPTLYTGSAFVGHDQTYRDVKRFVDYLGEEISCGRSFAYSFRRNLLPLAASVIQWLVAHHARYLDIVDTFVLVGFNHRFIVTFHRAVAETFDWHFHVALASTNPNFASKDVAECHRLAIIEGDG